MTEKLVCWRCGEPLQKVERSLPRLAKCQSCEADLHVCRMCFYYNPKLSEHCDHEMAEPARQVDQANFCDYLQLKPDAFVSDEYAKAKQASARLSSLFGEQSEKSESGSFDKDKLDPLKDLFKNDAEADSSKQD